MGGSDQDIQSFIADLRSGKLSYDEATRRYKQLGDAIKRQYERELTAVSVDVVQSRMTKGSGTDLDAQLTFDAFQRWVDSQLRDYAHLDATWAGDGLMAVFEQPEAAVWFGRTLLEGLPRLNRAFNQLRQPIQIRIGVHTGPILLIEKKDVGRIASRTFDMAGHLQKAAEPNQMLVGERTYQLLREGDEQFAPVYREVWNLGLCYAYPPHSARKTDSPVPIIPGAAGAPPPVAYSGCAPPPPAQQAAPTPAGSTPFSWVIAGSVVVAGVAIALAIIFTAPRGAGRAAAGPTFTQPVNLQAPPATIAGQSSGPPAQAGNTTTPEPTGNAPTPRPGPRPAPPAAPETPPQWEPQRALWRSPDADSGVPARLAPSGPDQRWVLSIGVGQYQDRGLGVEGAGEAARLVAEALRRGAGVAPDHVQILTDLQATRDNVKRCFQWLQQRAAAGHDTVFVYLAGAAAIAANREGLPAGSGYAFLPSDCAAQTPAAKALYGQDLVAWLGATHTQGIVLLVDTPVAGAIQLPAVTDPGRQFGLLAAAGGSHTASLVRGQRVSAFAEALALGLKGGADANRDRRITLDELQRYVIQAVTRASRGGQEPEARAGFGGYTPAIEFIPAG